MLLFVSISASKFGAETDATVQQAFVEFGKSPSSEAVFAVMSMQLKGNDGFNKVLALLTDLVHDGKEQLHTMTKTWRKVHARCMVTTQKYEHIAQFLKMASVHANTQEGFMKGEITDLESNLSENKSNHGTYSEILKNVISRHSADNEYNGKAEVQLLASVKTVEEAIESIKDWSPASAALVQLKIRKATSVLSKVQNNVVSTPIVLIQQATKDEKARTRLMEWATTLKNTLSSAATDTQSVITERKELYSGTETAIADLIASLEKKTAAYEKEVSYVKAIAKGLTAKVASLGDLITKHAAAQAANTKYCNNEDVNYDLFKVHTVDEVKLYTEIRKYFVDNYSKINTFIKAKYSS
jgi:hypothetical protein